MSNKFSHLTIGIKDVAPYLISVVPFGIIFGAIGIELGFDPIIVYGSSIIIFGGASQIAFLQLISGGASFFIAVTSVSVINSRHLLYGAVVSQYLDKLPIIKKIFISYILVDQSFAVSNKYFKKNKKTEYFHYHLIGSGITLWIAWQISTILGIFLGEVLPEELGLEFAIPLTFISVIINEFKKFDHVIVILISGVSSLILYEVPFKSYIILSTLIGLLAGIIITGLKK